MTDADAQTLIASVLVPGEQLIWSQGAPPNAGPESWLPAVSLTLIAISFAVVCACAAISKREPRMKPWQIAASALLLAVLPGLGAIHFWAQIAGASTTAYAITDQRVIIAARDPWRQVRSFGPDDVLMIGRRGDTVSIDYGPIYRSRDGYRTHLRGLAEPEFVESLIIEHVRDHPPILGDRARVQGAPP